MIIGLLICTIGIIPIVLALNVRGLYKGSELSVGLLIYMILISIWQANIGILYFKDLLSENTVLLLFRLFRIAPTFAIPATFYVAYIIITKYTTTFKSGNFLNKFLGVLFTKKALVGLILWSTIIYIINWTSLGITGLKVDSFDHSYFYFYFPTYGPLLWLYLFHMSSFILFLLFIFLLSKKILNPNMRNFLKTFSLCSLLLFIAGLINFSPSTGAIASSIGVIIFSVIIMLAFIRLNNTITLNYNNLLERQKKLDYTGTLSGSLIHEVKNIVVILKGFSKLLMNADTMRTDFEKGSLDMIQHAAQQLEDLANHYHDYINHSKIDFKLEDLNKIIELSIHFSIEILKAHRVKIEFEKKYSNLMAFVNKAYLQQVFINLIKNSSEAMPPERNERRIKIETDFIGDHIIINFYDTGKGIPPESWESIFDPFLSTKKDGMGFGLPFVKKIIFEHKGDIQVVESTSSGTHFQIKIPQLVI
ncbi:ATP-binding protein [Bacillota bacterium Lsc_1132]